MDVTLTEADWDGLDQVLRGCARVTVEECTYLKNVFVATERMWAEKVAKVATVRLVMLSEAGIRAIVGREQQHQGIRSTRAPTYLYETRKSKGRWPETKLTAAPVSRTGTIRCRPHFDRPVARRAGSQSLQIRQRCPHERRRRCATERLRRPEP